MAEKNNNTTAIWEGLRKAFPEEAVGSLPKGGISLDFVGHAAVTDRLNTVVGPDNWDLMPLAFGDDGIPVITIRGKKSVMWATLTINGASKLCVGTADSSKEEIEKELIGDALRNGAMRFGVALDLWTKDELESTLNDPSLKNDRPSKKDAPQSAARVPDAPTEHQQKAINDLLHQLLPGDENKVKRDNLRSQATTKKKASELIEQLQSKAKAAKAKEPVVESEVDKGFRDGVMDDFEEIGLSSSGKRRFFTEVTGKWFMKFDRAEFITNDDWWRAARKLIDQLLNDGPTDWPDDCFLAIAPEES